ncbi:MAG: hypothetical protein RML95_15350 [Anaerolineae bacterium]|nr:hypothetical protein [Anaerolineae bacterium]MDW8300707.1 hypothetical protein [Anaerolineae bacterium]
MIEVAWRALRLSLLALIVFGAVLSAALALGAADPPRHHRLHTESETLEGAWQLPEPPFTLIARGTWSERASPLDSWHLIFTGADGALRLTLSLHGDASFALAPLQADALGFIHLRRPPETNEVWLHVTAHEATLRLNRELAWRGTLPSMARVQLRGAQALRSATLRLYVP